MDLLVWLLPLIAWILTIRDIQRSEFIDDSKTKWLLLVILLVFIGNMFYYYFGIKKKEPYKFRFLQKIKA